MKRTMLILFVLAVLIGCTPKADRETGKAILTSAKLLYAEGAVLMDGKTIEIGAIIPEGALLATEADGAAEIVFGDKNIIRMGPDTIIRVNLETLNKTVTVDSGTVGAVLRKLDKLAGGNLEVRTQSLVAGVRGTSFFLRVRPEQQETYFCVCNGTIGLTAADQSESFEKTATHHDATIFTGTVEKAIVSLPGPGYDHGHTDQDMENLAAKIDETIEWGTADYGY